MKVLNPNDEIDIKMLNDNQYIISLLKEGIKKGLITSDDVLNIQIKIMELLKELIMKYTKGESTSVTVEVTESLLNSILYTLDFYMIEVNNPKAALKELNEREIKEIYEEGLQLLRICIIKTRQLYEKIKKERLDIELEAYNTTIDEAIPCFFEKYTVVFEAHNTMASIDYPLVFDDMKVRGISYIKNYLEHLEIETEFCRFFSEKDIENILCGFGKLCRLNHNIELINIFELLINNSIISVLCENEVRQLNITRHQYDILSKKLNMINLTAIKELISGAVEKILADLNINNYFLMNYIKSYQELFEKRIINALENKCLDKLIVIEQEEEEKYFVTFDEGKRMSDKSFKKTVDEIMTTWKVSDKINIINSRVHSLQDFMDILNADCFFGDEFHQIFNTLGDIELTILAKLVFYEEFRDGLIDLSVIPIDKKEMETEWQEHFIEFINNLDKNKKKTIEELIDKVDYEEIKF